MESRRTLWLSAIQKERVAKYFCSAPLCCRLPVHRKKMKEEARCVYPFAKCTAAVSCPPRDFQLPNQHVLLTPKLQTTLVTFETVINKNSISFASYLFKNRRQEFNLKATLSSSILFSHRIQIHRNLPHISPPRTTHRKTPRRHFHGPKVIKEISHTQLLSILF